MARALATNRQLATARTLAANRVASPYRAIVGDYFERVKATRPASLIGYWPFDESSGTAAINYSGLANANGIISGATVGQPGIGDGRTCYTFDGVNDYVQIWSNALASAFNGATGSFSLWARYTGAWNDGVARVLGQLRADASNRVVIQKTTGTNTLQVLYVAGGTTVTISKTNFNPTAWFHVLVTWDKPNDQVKFYTRIVGQSPQVVTATGLGTWAGALSITVTTVGAVNTSGGNPFTGGIQHPAVWTAAITQGEAERLDYAV